MEIHFLLPVVCQEGAEFEPSPHRDREIVDRALENLDRDSAGEAIFSAGIRAGKADFFGAEREEDFFPGRLGAGFQALFCPVFF